MRSHHLLSTGISSRFGALVGVVLVLACSSSGDDSSDSLDGTGGQAAGGSLGSHPLLEEPKGTKQPAEVNITAEGSTVPAFDLSFAGEYTESQPGSKYAACAFGNDPNNLGHTRLLLVAGTVGSDPTTTLLLRDPEAEGSEGVQVEFDPSSPSQAPSFSQLAPTTGTPSLVYRFGTSGSTRSSCYVELVELSSARAVGTLACSNLVSSVDAQSTLSATLTFNCPVGDIPTLIGTGGQTGVGGSGPLGGRASGGAPSGGAPSGGSGGGAVENLSPEAFCEAKLALERAWCDYIDSCCSEVDKDDLAFHAPACEFSEPDQDLCVGVIKDQAENGSTWDGRWAPECLDELAKEIHPPPLGCSGLAYGSWKDAYNNNPGEYRIRACRKMLTANTKEGERCDSFESCAPDLTCWLDDTFLCRPFRKLGEPCEFQESCAAELVCNWATNTCERPREEGESCLMPEDCKNGLACDFSTCTAPIPVGEVCSFSDLCQRGADCDFVDNGLECAPISQAGDECRFTSDCDGRCDTLLGRCVEICGGTLY